MSQVVVTNDRLREKRLRSGEQEHKISREDDFARWRRNDITGRDPVVGIILVAASPIVALWSMVAALIYALFGVIEYVFKALGKLLGGSKNLNTGE